MGIAGAAAVSCDNCLTYLNVQDDDKETHAYLRMGDYTPGDNNKRIIPIEFLKRMKSVAWPYVTRKGRYTDLKNIENVEISKYSLNNFIFFSVKIFFISNYFDLLFTELTSIGYLTSCTQNIVMIHLSQPPTI
jgi:hypothetical protein